MVFRNQDLSTKCTHCFWSAARAGKYTHIHTCMEKCKYIHTHTPSMSVFLSVSIYIYISVCIYISIYLISTQYHRVHSDLLLFHIYKFLVQHREVWLPLSSLHLWMVWSSSREMAASGSAPRAPGDKAASCAGPFSLSVA